jgi:hypothetical protein
VAAHRISIGLLEKRPASGAAVAAHRISIGLLEKRPASGAAAVARRFPSAFSRAAWLARSA